MKVLNLQCEHGHQFEGWFGSEDDYRMQQERGLLTCPVCGAQKVNRLPSAPRLNLSGISSGRLAERTGEPADASGSSVPAAVGSPSPSAPQHDSAEAVPADVTIRAFQKAWMETVQAVIANTEDVGARFPEEARRMHFGETEARAIRGQATDDERRELLEDGIEVVSLPIPDALKGPRH